ncbi:protein TolR [Methylosinus sp. R-45379]|jgi:biopolymer transport protein ExbD/biopolymer transport protein TolR|uniref:ExbD/TolR family protein n=1 Tax=unclassified Methylosinus TaxID=2624500 RepID=UPI0004633F00|nr:MULTISPECIES: biopolymer transporter ExbD [unclassified Methylosinus]OAI22595.1 protein TolR [Methylosinus sp. R-45379]TDX66728.1 cell division and transport-associated protein TolR [Methylosinus sp. sav-2]
MAFALRKHDSEFDSQPIADINVTPLVDVMLVLLIVFMVAAPLMTSGIPVDLPKVQAKQLNDQKPPIVVSVDAGGGFFVDKREVPADGLLAALSDGSDNSKDRRIHVRADKTVPYGRVVEAMGAINAAGYSKVALVSEAPTGGAKSAPAP